MLEQENIDKFTTKKSIGEIGKQEATKSMVGYHIMKRSFDVIVSGVMLIILIPVFCVFKIIYTTGGNKGPMFYRQVRIGKSGQPFGMYKFRSMVVDADKKLMANKELYAKYVANSYKLPEGEDPRVTKFGRFIRKTSLDELPQFINVFSGEMSIIGPRPIVKNELKEYGTQERIDKLLSVTPGAMGYWQASGRSNIEYPERCDVELFYIDHASFGFDLKIMFKNVASIFKHDGAF